VIPAARRGFLAPKDIWDFPDRSQWPTTWLAPTRGEMSDTPFKLSALGAWTPYVLLGLFLFLSRSRYLPLRLWLQAFEIRFSNIFGTDVTKGVQPLFLPATVFIVVVGVTYFLHRMRGEQLQRAIAGAAQKLLGTALAIGASVPMATVFINSGVNASGLASMPLTLADGVSSLVGSVWPFFAPIIGLMGSFVAGSTTVSNMMFSLFQFGVAQQIGAPTSAILALQGAGAAAGNMIAVSNIVAAVATVGLIGREGILLRQLLLPVILYSIFAGVIGILTVTLNG
jgi:lactate permease